MTNAVVISSMSDLAIMTGTDVSGAESLVSLSQRPSPLKIVEQSALSSLRGPWMELGRSSVEANPYYSPAYALALLETVAANDRVRAATVWQGERLLGFLPYRTRRFWLWHAWSLVHVAWLTVYTYSGMPLLDGVQAAQAADSLLAGLADKGQFMWLLPRLNLDGPTIKTLTAALDRRGAPWAITGRFERASFDTGVSFEEHMKTFVGGKRRGELSRNRRRLEERGKLTYLVASEGVALAAAVDSFLKLEAKGWKGARGSALASHPETLAFARRVLAGGDEDYRVRADMLLLDGKVVAISITLLSGGTGFTIKSAYDEDYRRFGVGLMLQEFMIRDFLENNWAQRLDSATSGGHVIEGLWPNRIAVGDLAFSLDPRMTRERFDKLMAIENWRRQIRSEARKWHERAGAGLMAWLARWDGTAKPRPPA